MRGLPMHLISGMLPLSRYSTQQRTICFTGVNCCSGRNFSEFIGAIKGAPPPAQIPSDRAAPQHRQSPRSLHRTLSFER